MNRKRLFIERNVSVRVHLERNYSNHLEREVLLKKDQLMKSG